MPTIAQLTKEQSLSSMSQPDHSQDKQRENHNITDIILVNFLSAKQT